MYFYIFYFIFTIACFIILISYLNIERPSSNVWWTDYYMIRFTILKVNARSQSATATLKRKLRLIHNCRLNNMLVIRNFGLNCENNSFVFVQNRKIKWIWNWKFINIGGYPNLQIVFALKIFKKNANKGALENIITITGYF